MDETEANTLGKKSNSWILSHIKVDEFNYLIMIHNSEYFCFVTDNNIQKFAAFYRSTFPEETSPPQFHMLEDHVVSFIKKWKFSLGLFGEQGGESIHHEFKLFEQTNIFVKPASERLNAWTTLRCGQSWRSRRRDKEPEKESERGCLIEIHIILSFLFPRRTNYRWAFYQL